MAMITVRFPSGFSIQYNDAAYAVRLPHYTDLYTSSDESTRRWVAQVPTQGCVVEVVQPCRTYDANAVSSDAVAAVARLLEDPSQRLRCDSYVVSRIKRACGDFNATTRRWSA